RVGGSASAGSEGFLATACIPLVTADALFYSEGRYSSCSPVTGPGSGEGALTAVSGATGTVVVPADFGGSGVCSAASGTSFAASGAGELSVHTGAPADNTGIGTLAQVSAAWAGVGAGCAGAGSLSVDAVPSFQPSSMTKNGSWNKLNSRTWETISGWKPDTTRYPGSVV
ncbi:hypothetical protein ACW9HQ_53565, partial [Nocardia gipuzkoensis]